MIIAVSVHIRSTINFLLRKFHFFCNNRFKNLVCFCDTNRKVLQKLPWISGALFSVFSSSGEHILLLRKICWHSWWQSRLPTLWLTGAFGPTWLLYRRSHFSCYCWFHPRSRALIHSSGFSVLKLTILAMEERLQHLLSPQLQALVTHNLLLWNSSVEKSNFCVVYCCVMFFKLVQQWTDKQQSNTTRLASRWTSVTEISHGLTLSPDSSQRIELTVLWRNSFRHEQEPGHSEEEDV